MGPPTAYRYTVAVQSAADREIVDISRRLHETDRPTGEKPAIRGVV